MQRGVSFADRLGGNSNIPKTTPHISAFEAARCGLLNVKGQVPATDNSLQVFFIYNDTQWFIPFKSNPGRAKMINDQSVISTTITITS